MQIDSRNLAYTIDDNTEEAPFEIKPTRKEDNRYSVTLKHERLSPEWRNLIKAAARKTGMDMALFIAVEMQEASMRILHPVQNAKAELPALARVEALEKRVEVLTEVEKRVGELQEAKQHLSETNTALDAKIEELQSKVFEINERARRPLLKRLFS